MNRAAGIRARVLVAVTVVVGGASWVVLKLLEGGGRDRAVGDADRPDLSLAARGRQTGVSDEHV